MNRAVHRLHRGMRQERQFVLRFDLVAAAQRLIGVTGLLGDQTGLFASTVGGLGLTGLITKVALQLRRIDSASLAIETTPFGNLDHPVMRRAMYFGSALGSFAVEGIGPRRLLDVTPADLQKRMQAFMSLVETGGPVELPA